MSNGGIAPQVIRHSVTKDDHEKAGGGVFQFMVANGPAAPGLHAYWTPQRDFQLAGTVHLEAMWSAAIGKAISKQAALGWKVTDTNDSTLRTKRAQDLLLNADAGEGWVSFLSKHLRNYLCTDNGAFIEVVRATSAYGSKILGIMHLDSHRCVRTGDPAMPVLYRDLKGAEHVLKAHQVLMFADMPDPSESYRGVGLCAASRAWVTISKLAAIERYLSEKVTGSRPTEIHIVNGITAKQFEDALATADAEQKRRGLLQYKGPIVVPAMAMDAVLNLISIPLSSIPDGFDAKQERDNAYMIYANAIGIPVQDIQPLSGQGLGTGTQTKVLDDAAEVQGLAAWQKQFEHAWNEFLLPESTTFTFATNDIHDQQATAEVKKARAETRKLQIDSGEITAVEARQLAVDDGDLPRELVPNDVTAGGTLQDDQKPIEETEAAATVAPVSPVPVVATKAKRPFAAVAALLDGEMDAAEDLYQEVVGDAA